MKDKGTLAFSLSSKDFDWEFFNNAHGPGGQKMQKTSSCVRVFHKDSGARATATESRSQLINRKTALKRLVETAAFKAWVSRKLSDGPTPEEIVERDMVPHNIRIEGRVNGKWQQLS